jgi:uncharacterized protein YaaR (DUF327 family)
MENISAIDITRAVDKKAIKETFKMKLEDIEQENIRNELKVLYDKIEIQSNKLQDRLFIDDLINYKKLIKEFLNVTVNNSHIFFKENSLDRRGRHRIYSLVKKVDQELDELTQDFLDSENKRINILKRLNDIKGILMDIMT